MYKELIKQRNIIKASDLDKIVKEVYELPYDIQRGEYSQNSYIKVDGVDGKPADESNSADEIGYWTGLSMNSYRINYDNAEYMDLDYDNEESVVEYWKNHSNTNASGYSHDRPFDERYLDENGEYALWQPPEYWVLNNLCNKGLIPAGDYLITISW